MMNIKTRDAHSFAHLLQAAAAAMNVPAYNTCNELIGGSYSLCIV
jgi:hypothetical protein